MFIKDHYITEENFNKFIARYNILRDKVNFGLPLNKIDDYLLDILEEYDFYIKYIDEEQKNRSKKYDLSLYLSDE